MRHKITVIMAAYEGEDYIGQQIDSVLSQTVWDLQLIISDDGSGDNTRKILEEYFSEPSYKRRTVCRQSRPGSSGCHEFFLAAVQSGGRLYITL